MTYNWNTMVEITVPTGTNGWLYSGEVIINGVKVRFPVGVPTSVPEPAAVLLKKMIELEQEEDANTAKPQNHYVGSVTIPAGKTLTLEKGSKLVDNSGPSEVVILPETEMDLADIVEDELGQYGLTTPLENTPAAGSTCKLIWGGVEFSGKVADMSDTLGEGVIAAYAMGNLAIMTGGEAPEGIPNPDPTAPYFLAMFPDGFAIEEGMTKQYVIMFSQGFTPDPPVLSIVQTEGAASGGESAGGGVVTATAVIGDGPSVTSIDKTYSELLSAVKAGKYVQMMAKIGTSITAVPFVFWMEEDDSGYMLFSMQAKTVAATIQYNADGTAEWAQ